MKVILLTDVKGQGKKDDIIDVSIGYANNFLIKNKLAVAYTVGSKKVLDNQLKERMENEQLIIAGFNDIKNKLQNMIVEFKVKTGKDDKVFGTISTKQISDQLFLKTDYKIDKKNILLEHPIDSLGVHSVKITLHKEVSFRINVKLIKN